MRHAHADGKMYRPSDTGYSTCEHQDSHMLRPFSVTTTTLNKHFDEGEPYPEPLKLLVPGWIEGEPLHSRLFGVSMKFKLDVGVRVAIGVSRWQVFTLLQSDHDSTLQAECFTHSICKVIHTPTV